MKAGGRPRGCLVSIRVHPFFYLLSPLRSKDVELDQTLTGSVTVWEFFTKTSLQMTKGSSVCVQTEY